MALMVKNPAANARDIRDPGSTPGSGRSPGEGHGNPLQYFCLENPRDRGAWQATAHGVVQSRTQLSNLAWCGVGRSFHSQNSGKVLRSRKCEGSSFEGFIVSLTGWRLPSVLLPNDHLGFLEYLSLSLSTWMCLSLIWSPLRLPIA